MVLSAATLKGWWGRESGPILPDDGDSVAEVGNDFRTRAAGLPQEVGEHGLTP